MFGEPISSIAYFNLAKAFTITNDSFLLLGFIKEVSELIFPRSATVVNRIILAFAECGHIDNALLIFDHMKSLKCKPDLFMYNTVLRILGRVEESLRLFDEMKQRCIQPSIYIYRSLINNIKKMGKTDLAMTLLEEMNTSQADLVGPKNFRQKKQIVKLKK